MRMNEIAYTNAKPVEGYGPGFFRIDGTVYRGPVLVSAVGIGSWGGYADLEPLMALRDKIDVLFLGTGAEIAHPPVALREMMEAVGIAMPLSDEDRARHRGTVERLLQEAERHGVIERVRDLAVPHP